MSSVLPDFDDLDGLLEAVEDQGNLAVCAMFQLRDACGWDRLTARIAEDIEVQLAQRALGVFPRPIPQSRRAEVRVYKKGTSLGNLVDAVLDPAEHRDDLLRASANRDSDDILRKVQRLVCDA